MKKLVRDKMPEIIKAKGEKVKSSKAGEDSILDYTLDKILEEAEEICSSQSYGNLIEEIGDLMTVLDKLMEIKKISWKQVMCKKYDKDKERGVFDNNVIMECK